MIYNTLDNTDISISEFGFGASPLGNIFNNPISDNEAQRCIKTAIDNGINYFDVAPYYGNGLAEKRLATLLGKEAKKIILSTKVGRYGKNKFDFSTNKIDESIHHSLKLFSREHLDIVFCHDIEFVDSKTILETALPHLIKLKKKGMIQAIGISGYPLDILYNIAKQFPIDLILSYSQYTLINQSLKTYQKKFQKLGINSINASPFDMGLLTQHNCPTWHPASKALQKKIKILANNYHKKGISLEKVAFQYTLSYKQALSHLIGIGSHQELEQCINWYKTPLDSFQKNNIQTIINELN
tara:strand:+ start:815 stop:1708 length:894 start_codon:yes stop_codon:yes gene_type:complete